MSKDRGRRSACPPACAGRRGCSWRSYDAAHAVVLWRRGGAWSREWTRKPFPEQAEATCGYVCSPSRGRCGACALIKIALHVYCFRAGIFLMVRSVQQSSAGGRGGPAGYRPSGGPTAQNGEAVQARLRQIDPAQLKQMLLSHVRFCKNEHSAGRVTTCASASSRATPRRHMLTSSSLPARARQVSTSLCSSRARGRPGGADRPATAHRAGRPRRTTRRCEWPSVSRWRVEACRCCRPAF